MRLVVVLCLLLSACAAHEVRCDRKLLQINRPGALVSATAATPMPAPAPAPAAGAGVDRP